MKEHEQSCEYCYNRVIAGKQLNEPGEHPDSVQVCIEQEFYWTDDRDFGPGCPEFKET